MRPNFASLLLALALACPAARRGRADARRTGCRRVFEAIEANRLDDALKRVDALIRDYPNFRLAHLVRGDLLLARSRPLLTFGNVVKTVPQEKIDGLRDEALARLRAQRQRPAEDRLPRLRAAAARRAEARPAGRLAALAPVRVRQRRTAGRA